MTVATFDCYGTLIDWEGGAASFLYELARRKGDEDGRALVRAMESWQPFPDTVPALRAARDAGLRLWIVSNTDRSIMAHTLRHLDVGFDGVTVAEDARGYKPGRAPFELALRELHEAPERVLHVAFGFEYDIATAQELGMRTAWVNRAGEERPGTALPDLEWRDLWPLAEVAARA